LRRRRRMMRRWWWRRGGGGEEAGGCQDGDCPLPLLEHPTGGTYLGPGYVLPQGEEYLTKRGSSSSSSSSSISKGGSFSRLLGNMVLFCEFGWQRT